MSAVYAATEDYSTHFGKPPFFRVTGIRDSELELMALKPGTREHSRVEKWVGGSKLTNIGARTANFIDEKEIKGIISAGQLKK